MARVLLEHTARSSNGREDVSLSLKVAIVGDSTRIITGRLKSKFTQMVDDRLDSLRDAIVRRQAGSKIDPEKRTYVDTLEGSGGTEVAVWLNATCRIEGKTDDFFARELRALQEIPGELRLG